MNLHLKSLELSGFKSFAKKSKLLFKTPVTAIVGPNGSGKSNVVEAFRFALGEQRITHMRGKRTEDLIWNGSQKTPKSNRASVSVVFDNTSHLFDVDFEEVALQRTIHRDASTDYALNGSTIRLKDIVELLSGAHIGATGHHIISQGETDRILSVSPKERRAMIEEALGLKVYQYKKEESLKKLEKTKENKKEVLSLRREIKPHLAFLKRQVEKIEKTKEMREKLALLYKEYIANEQALIHHLESDIRKKKEPLEKEHAHIQELLKAERQKITTTTDAEDVELVRMDKELSLLREEKDKETRELGHVEGTLSAIQEQERRVAKEQSEKTIKTGYVLSFLEGHARELDTLDTSNFKDVIGKIKESVLGFIQSIRSTSNDENQAFDDERTKELEEKKIDILGRMEDISHKEEGYEKQKKERMQILEQQQSAEKNLLIYSAQEADIKNKLGHLESEQRLLAIRRGEFEEEKREAVAFTHLTMPETTYSIGEIDIEVHANQKKEIEKLKIRIEDAGSGSGEDILKEYDDVQKRDEFLEREIADLEDASEKLFVLIDELDKKITEEFKEGIEKINTHFQELFSLMFGGGTAQLRVVRERVKQMDDSDADEEIKEGVEITISLPRKKIHGLQMLSGGERALTSVAVLFAMSQVNPPPFLVLDETDAALDEANSKRYGDMIERLAKHSQLILITHNRETMSRAGVLYGVTMGSDGSSQLLSVDFEEAVKVAK